MTLPSPLDLGGRTALVTGSTRGLGWSSARCMASLGATVAINGRSADAVAARCREIEAEGGRALPAAFDVTDRTALAAAIERIRSETGSLDIFVASAADFLIRSVEETTDEQVMGLLEAKYLSAFAGARLVLPGMRERGWGRIVFVSSIGVIASGGKAPADSGASGGLATLAKAISTANARHGITCNAVAPGFFETDTTKPYRDDPANAAWLAARVPAGRWGLPDEIGWPVAFLATDAASFVTGHTLVVDGGITSSY